jgi:endonuclease IV
MPAPEAAPAAEAPADPVAAMEARVMALEEKINAIIAKIEEEAQPESVIEDMAVQNQNFKAAIEKLTDIVDQLSQTPVEEPSNFFQSFNLPKTKKDHLASIADNIASIKQSFKNNSWHFQ